VTHPTGPPDVPPEERIRSLKAALFSWNYGEPEQGGLRGLHRDALAWIEEFQTQLLVRNEQISTLRQEIATHEHFKKKFDLEIVALRERIAALQEQLRLMHTISDARDDKIMTEAVEEYKRTEGARLSRLEEAARTLVKEMRVSGDEAFAPPNNNPDLCGMINGWADALGRALSSEEQSKPGRGE
jgi:chromosome segregation ATPase